MVFEIFAVFVPVYLVIRSWAMVRRVKDSNSRWETASAKSSSADSSSLYWKGSCNSLSEKNNLDLLDEELGDRLLTMTALDYVLRDNPGPLQDFSAIHDFSGENIAFLTRAARFKAAWPVMPAGEQRIDVYNEALSIYTDFISTRHAEFPLNLASRELKTQEAIFEEAARSLIGESDANPAIPFDIEASAPSSPVGSPISGKAPGFDAAPSLVCYKGDVPDAFNLAVFDHIQSHVKYLVLTNTWPKFVAEMQSRRRSSETQRSEETLSSQRSIGSKLSRRLAKLLADLGL